MLMSLERDTTMYGSTNAKANEMIKLQTENKPGLIIRNIKDYFLIPQCKAATTRATGQ